MLGQSKQVTFILLVLSLVMMLSYLSPVISYAGGIFDDFDVNVDDEGGIVVDSEADTDGAWSTLIGKYKNFIVGIAGVGAITMVVLFIIQFLKLGASAGNPQERSRALTGVLWTGIAAAGLGAVALITGIFYNAI